MSFGETILFGAVPLLGIADLESAPGGTREGPRVRLKTSDLDAQGIGPGSILVIRSIDYWVQGIQPDGVGTTMCILTRQ